MYLKLKGIDFILDRDLDAFRFAYDYFVEHNIDLEQFTIKPTLFGFCFVAENKSNLTYDGSYYWQLYSSVDRFEIHFKNIREEFIRKNPSRY